jgi:hypothetical protein
MKKLLATPGNVNCYCQILPPGLVDQSHAQFERRLVGKGGELKMVFFLSERRQQLIMLSHGWPPHAMRF